MGGRLITLEGGEGAGKTSCLEAIEETLRRAGVPHVMTREPGGTPVGERLRSLLLDPELEPLEPEAELLLVFAARAQHIARVIEPALDRGLWVLCDRFTDASYAYQGAGRGLAPARIRMIEDWVQGPLRPDLTLLLDVPAEVGLRRARRQGPGDRFEREALVFYERVRAAYRARARAEPERFEVIDAAEEQHTVRSKVVAAIRRYVQEVKGA